MDITVVGEGTVLAAPDTLRLYAGVEVRRASAAESFTAARAAAARLTEVLRQEGIAAEDVRTTELSLGPEYEAYPKVTAYRAAQGVEVVVRDLARADRIIDTVAGVGEEARLNGLAFEVSDPSGPLSEARTRAFRDAAGKAAQYAGLAGRPLGRVVSVTEEIGGGPPQPLLRAATMAAEDASSINPGRQTLTVTVRLGYDFA
ncbi:SIMPL domain-containing protein [Nonomuraea sp. SYSU D8015]|uniref:SIMPL domain-containing protein n=1 Tax=Nonomuraea sp. SYSU D8015 TaxID=2593644 RepID=UPI0016606D64|nr:SIMPL domain-containing protein [Nonomuraea sp. SYSU D8015]